jgi:hypothetical protein
MNYFCQKYERTAFHTRLLRYQILKLKACLYKYYSFIGRSLKAEYSDWNIDLSTFMWAMLVSCNDICPDLIKLPFLVYDTV